VAVDPWRKDIAYLSYYSGGLRVIRYDEKTGITEVGAYISEQGNNFWGVEVHRLPKGTKGAGKETLILASDRDSGLWIFTYDETGKGKGKSAGKPAKPGKAAGSAKVQRMDEMPAKAKGKGLVKKGSRAAR
jgi:Tol biopolymer transport system component